MTHNHRYHQAKSITLVGAVVNVFLGIIKVLGGIFFLSHALIADGLHSFSDLFTDVMVLFASKYGSQDADDSHPYGHQRIETAATLMLAMLLILAGAGIAWDSLNHIFYHTVKIPEMWALPIVVISIVANEVLYYLTIRVGLRINSPLIIANAWHHRSDAAASGIVLIGIVGSLFGFSYLDPLAAVVIGGMIIKMGISYGWNSVKELVDTGVDPAQILEIKRVINAVDGVSKIHQLRSRKMGADVLVDVHVLVSPWISVSEGHHIAQRVHQSLIDAIDEIKDVVVHIDPEDDELVSPSLDLPTRMDIEKTVLHGCLEQFPQIQTYVLHYLDGMISIDIYLEEGFNHWIKLRKDIEKELPKQLKIGSIRFLEWHTKFSIKR